MMTRCLLLTCLMLLMPVAGKAQPVVAVTIRPLQFIAAAILDGVNDPVPVMRANASPHYYAMRPSERRSLAGADLLLWVGPSLEGFLAGLGTELEAQLITVEELEDLHQLRLGRDLDPHVWLDLANVELIAAALTRAVSAIDPANARRYESNLGTFRDSLDDMRQDLRNRIDALDRQAPYAVYHNAFSYYEAQFGFKHLVSFTDNEEFSPGIKRMLEIKAILDANTVGCIVVEPRTNIRQLAAVVDNIGVRYVPVDVLGSDIAVGPQSYFTLMRSVSDGLLACLE